MLQCRNFKMKMKRNDYAIFKRMEDLTMRRLFISILIVFMTVGLLTAQTIKVKSPNGGEKWPLESKQKITWVATGVTNDIRIFLVKNGVQLGLIVPTANTNLGYYEWVVGTYQGGVAQPGPGYTVKLKVMGKDIVDFSDNPFTIQDKSTSIEFNPGLAKNIAKAMVPKVTEPHKGSNWKEGTVETIRWETPLKPPFTVDLYNYNGQTKVRQCLGMVKSDGGNKYSLPWSIPTDVYTFPGNYTIRVSQGNMAGLSEMFHISKALSIKTYTFTAITVNKIKEKWYKPDKDVFTMKIEPSASDPGPGKARVGYENHNSSDLYTGFIYRSWVSFDVGQLKGKGLVSKATLSFKHFMGCQFTPGVYLLDQKWGGDPMALFNIPCSKIDPSANLGLIVNGWLSKGDNYGLVFVGQNESFQHNNNQCIGFFENIILTVEVIEDVK